MKILFWCVTRASLSLATDDGSTKDACAFIINVISALGKKRNTIWNQSCRKWNFSQVKKNKAKKGKTSFKHYIIIFSHFRAIFPLSFSWPSGSYGKCSALGKTMGIHIYIFFRMYTQSRSRNITIITFFSFLLRANSEDKKQRKKK